MDKEYIDKNEILYQMSIGLIPQDYEWTRAYALARKLIKDAPAEDVEPVRHAYWTGKLPEDEACAEGLPTNATEEERIEYLELKNNLTHCSNCKGGYDGRKIHSVRYCQFCGAKMDKEN